MEAACLLRSLLRNAFFPVAIVIFFFFAASQSASSRVAAANATMMFVCEERTPGLPDKEGRFRLILNDAGEGLIIEGRESTDLSPGDLNIAGNVLQVNTGDGYRFEIDTRSGLGKLFLADVHTYDLVCGKQKRSRVYDRVWARLETQTHDASPADIERAIEVFEEIRSNKNICRIYTEFTGLLFEMTFEQSAFDDGLAEDAEEVLRFGLGEDFEKAYRLKVDRTSQLGKRYRDALGRLGDACDAMAVHSR